MSAAHVLLRLWREPIKRRGDNRRARRSKWRLLRQQTNFLSRIVARFLCRELIAILFFYAGLAPATSFLRLAKKAVRNFVGLKLFKFFDCFCRAFLVRSEATVLLRYAAASSDFFCIGSFLPARSSLNRASSWDCLIQSG